MVFALPIYRASQHVARGPGQASSSRGRGRSTAGRRSQPKKAPKRQKFSRGEINSALAEWIRDYNGGAFMDLEAVQALRNSANDRTENFVPFKTLMVRLDVIQDMMDLGYGDKNAPIAARRQMVTQNAVGQVVGRSEGWIQNALKVRRLILTYGDEPSVAKYLKKAKKRAVGVRTLLEALVPLVDETPPSNKGKKRQRDEDDEDDDDDDDDDDDEGSGEGGQGEDNY